MTGTCILGGVLLTGPSQLSILDCFFTTNTLPPDVTSELVLTFDVAPPTSSGVSLPPREPELQELRRLGCSDEALDITGEKRGSERGGREGGGGETGRKRGRMDVKGICNVHVHCIRLNTCTCTVTLNKTRTYDIHCVLYKHSQSLKLLHTLVHSYFGFLGVSSSCGCLSSRDTCTCT